MLFSLSPDLFAQEKPDLIQLEKNIQLSISSERLEGLPLSYNNVEPGVLLTEGSSEKVVVKTFRPKNKKNRLSYFRRENRLEKLFSDIDWVVKPMYLLAYASDGELLFLGDFKSSGEDKFRVWDASNKSLGSGKKFDIGIGGLRDIYEIKVVYPNRGVPISTYLYGLSMEKSYPKRISAYLNIAEELLKILKVFASRNIVHGDFHEQNILLHPEKGISVIDFNEMEERGNFHLGKPAFPLNYNLSDMRMIFMAINGHLKIYFEEEKSDYRTIYEDFRKDIVSAIIMPKIEHITEEFFTNLLSKVSRLKKANAGLSCKNFFYL